MHRSRPGSRPKLGASYENNGCMGKILLFKTNSSTKCVYWLKRKFIAFSPLTECTGTRILISFHTGNWMNGSELTRFVTGTCCFWTLAAQEVSDVFDGNCVIYDDGHNYYYFRKQPGTENIMTGTLGQFWKKKKNGRPPLHAPLCCSSIRHWHQEAATTSK